MSEHDTHVIITCLNAVQQCWEDLLSETDPKRRRDLLDRIERHERQLSDWQHRHYLDVLLNNPAAI